MTAALTSALTVLVLMLAKITLLLLVAWAYSLLLRRSSAAVRHFVWASALGSVLLLPVLAFGLPHWNVALAPKPAPPLPQIGLPDAAWPDTDVPVKSASVQPTAHAPITPVEPLPAAAPLPALGQSAPFPASLFYVYAALAFWALGFLFVFVPFLAGLQRIDQIGTRAQPLSSEALAGAEAMRGRLHVRPVFFGRAAPGSGVAVPITWGLLRSNVLLPAQSADWPDACLEAALLHELAHVKRGDWLTQCLARLTCALYWWHPLVWVAASRLRAESERACDDLVLSTGIKPTDYAARLVEVVRSLPPGASSHTIAIAMAQPSEVEGRIKDVLAKRSRRPLSRVMVIVLLLVVGAAASAVAALQLASAASAIPPGSSSAAGNSVPLTNDLMHPESPRQLERAMALRVHLQPWAEANKTLLQRMAHSKPNDYTALLAVYASFDRLPLPLWLADPRIGRPGWTPTFSGITSCPTLTHLQRSHTAEDVRIREDYAKYQDLELTQTIGAGPVGLVLWASGRITRSTFTMQFMESGKPYKNVVTQQQIVPGYFSEDSPPSDAAAMPSTTTIIPWERSVTATDTETRRAQEAFLASYTSGNGKMGILNIPATWQADRSTYHDALHLLKESITGDQAIVTTLQEDSGIAVDSRNGERLEATAEAIFDAKWELTPKGWIVRWYQCRSLHDKLDGVPLTDSAQKTKPFMDHGNPFQSVTTQNPLFQKNLSRDASPVPPLKTSVGFRRYLSPPLPDGSRYTFLYPSYYTKTYPGWLNDLYQFGTVRMDCIGSQPVPWVARPGQKPVLYLANHAPAPHEEFFSVEVSKEQVLARPIPQARVNNSQWIGINGSHHALTLTDARSGYRFELIHDDRYTPEIFKQTDSVIMQSFRILPPE